ncbi:MAG: type I secretion C-terminal target domain-containing protein, partial [Magnetococcales bacterium]|nr:type I secretion C-terminal target domain-containing protein [Magnetococcales bacterium]
DGTDTITDFSAGDTLDITGMLGSYNYYAGDPIRDGWIEVTKDATSQDVIVKLDTTGSGDFTNAITLVILLDANLIDLTNGMLPAGPALDQTVTGTDDSNLLYGGSGNDTMDGLAGLDTLHGGAGDDTIHGGSNNYYGYYSYQTEKIYGDAGNDTLYGDEGQDELRGGTGNDHLYGGSDGSWDYLYGEVGDDALVGRGMLYGGDGSDILTGDGSLLGEAGDDTLAGSGRLEGGVGKDTLTGSNGDDVLLGGPGDDVMTGGAGADRFVFDYYDLQYVGNSKYVLNGSDQGAYVGDHILDFQAGDQLDLANILYYKGYNGANPFGEGWLTANQVGTDVEVRFGANGHVDGYSDLIVTLDDTPLDLLISNVLPGGLQMKFSATSGNDHFEGNAFDTTYQWDQSDGTFGGQDAIQDAGGQDQLLFGHLHDVAIRVAQSSADLSGTGPLSVDIDHAVVDSVSGAVGLTFDTPDSQISLTRAIEKIAATDGSLTSTASSQPVDLHTVLEGTEAQSIDTTHTAYLVAGNAQDNQIDLSGISDAAHTLVLGGAGNDSIVGSRGEDTLVGGTGQDVLQGGAGQDILTGGADNDQFRFVNPSEGSATFAKADIIRDFTPLEDVISLGSGFASNAAHVEISYAAGSLAALQTALDQGTLDTLAHDAGVAAGENYSAFLSFTDNDGGTESGSYLLYDAGTDATHPHGVMTVLAELEHVTANHFSQTDVLHPVG